MTNEKAGKSKAWRPQTQMVRGGTTRSQYGETSEALYLNSGFVYDSPEQQSARMAGDEPGYIYSRYANPTVRMFEERLAQLEGAEACVAFGSGMAALTGRVEVRFADTALITQAIDGTLCELVFAWSLGANASFTFTAHAVYLPRPRIEIPGPQGIQATFDWQAAKAVSPARMCTAVLVNTVVSY